MNNVDDILYSLQFTCVQIDEEHNCVKFSLPKISIVTCSYQQARYIDSTLRSVLSQKYSKMEYIVVDGASTDGSVEIIRRYADRLAYWVSEPDAGQTDALIKGFGRSTGEVQGWVCSDDLLMPGALERVGQFFASNPNVDFVFGDALWIDAEGKLLRPKKEMSWNRLVYLFDHNYLAQPSCFWRRSLFERVGGLDRNWNLAMDSDLWLRFARHTQPYHLNSYLSCMRYYPGQKTRSLKPEGRREDEVLRVREAPVLSRLPRLPLRIGARCARAAMKFANGGYTASAPPEIEPWLHEHSIA